MDMEQRKIVVVVEEAEVAKTALKWALQNILRHGDVLTLVHVFPYYPPTTRRISGTFSLSRTFASLIPSMVILDQKIEIIVTQDDQQRLTIVGLVQEIGAFALVLGLHHHSFIYRLAMSQGHSNITNTTLNCQVLAIKQPVPCPTSSTTPSFTGSPNLEFSQIDIAPLQVPDISPPKIPYQICPSPHAILWRSKKTRRRERPI